MEAGIEAVKGNSKGFFIEVSYLRGGWPEGKTVTLNSQLGKLSENTLTVNPWGIATSATAPDGFIEFTSDGTPGWGEVSATVEGQSARQAILCRRVRVKDFSEPQLLRYNPDSEKDELARPKIEFTIEDDPNVGKQFAVNCRIYSLNSHNPIAQQGWLVPAKGTYTKEWSDFFFTPGTPQSQWKGRSVDPGYGIYSFQFSVQPSLLDVGLDWNVLKAKGIENVRWDAVICSDYKSSEWLEIKPRSQEAWSLSYDEDTDTTKLAYVVDVLSWNGKEPQTVCVDVYDPELNKVAEVTNQTIEHTVVPYGHGKIFTYYFNGLIKLDMAGDYHFVVRAQTRDIDETDNPDHTWMTRDAGKWAIEQGSIFSPKVDVDMDVDNTTMRGYPVSANGDRSDTEEAAESTHTATIWANLGDDDADEVPNFADGIDIFGNGNANACRAFEPLLMDSTVTPNGKYIFRYAASDPNLLSKDVVNGETVYSLPDDNILRVWKKDGMASRNPKSAHQGGDYLMPGQPYSAQDLGLTSGTTRTFFVEMLEASDRENPLTITVEFYPFGVYPSAPVRQQTLRVAGYEFGFLANPNPNP